MLDPDLKNPNPIQIPPWGSDDVIRTKKSTRSQSKDSNVMNKQSKGVSKPTHVSFKKGSLKYGGKKGSSIEMEGVEFDDENSAGLEKELVSDIVNESIKVNMSNVGMFVSGSLNDLGPIPVLVKDNHLLNPRTSPVVSHRIIKRGEALTDGGNRSNVEFSFYNVEKWPSLSGKVNVGNEGMRRGNVDAVMNDSGSVKKLSSFINVVQGLSNGGSNKLNTFPVIVNDKGKFVADLDPIIEKGSKNRSMTLVGYFVGLKMSYREIMGHLRRMWIAYHLGEVKIMNVPLEAWNAEGIGRITSCIGTPIIIDRITTSMCEKSYGRASFARVLIEVEARKGLVDNVEVSYKSLGKSMVLRVEYPWKPPLCSHCKVFGHGYDRCSNRVLTETELKQGNDLKMKKQGNGSAVESIDNYWQTISSRKNVRRMGMTGCFNNQRNFYGESSSRGGFGRRYRGGMNGRGYGDQRYSKNEGVQYVPVKKNVSTSESDKVNEQNDRGMSTIEIDRTKSGTSGSSNIKDDVKTKIDEAFKNDLHVSREEINSWHGDLKEYYNKKCHESIRKTDVEELKLKITNMERKIAYSNKMIAIESRNKANNMCKSIMEEEGISKNQAYQKVFDEVYRDELERIKEMTDDMIEFYRTKVGEEAYEKMEAQIGMDCKGKMEDEVAEDLSGNAQFIAKNVVSNGIDGDLNQMQGSWVSNSIDSSKGCRIVVGWDTNVMTAQLLLQTNQIMHFLVRCFKDNRQMYVSIIFGENSLRARLKLWKDLLELNAIAGNNPWVMLGDFNVVLKVNENTNCMNVRGEGIQEFVRCVESLEMEDINMCGIFYTWIQRMKNLALGILKKLDRIMGKNLFISMFPASFANFMPYLSLDHCPAVLCMPDVIVKKLRSFRFMNFLTEKNGFREVVKDNWSIDVQGYAMFKLIIRLKAMKKHLRRFNRQNGNVFEKVKFLQTELARVQECLDKDPSNSLFREEEMIYASAYREAAIDEERLLKQKTKIEWLKEGDSNSSYFHNAIKGRVSRTSRPYGYTTKFFKAAWNVVDQDVYCAVKEFFVTGKILGELNATLISLIPKGDPISPYLFTLVMEVLNLMIKRQIRNDKRFKYHLGCQKLEISSLYFADDLLILCHGDMVSPSILRRGIDEFSMSSGLYPSMSKSNAFFCNIPPDVKDEIKLVMPFNEGVLPIRYLGVPLVSKRVTKNDCRILIVVIQNKVNSWKNKFLSFVGRLQLIASVLSAMQVYWCSLFILPLTVYDDIDSLMSNFLWSNTDEIGSMVSVKWSDVCRPKNQGGLGLKSMHEWNIALMAKHLWSIISNKNTIWVKWVKVHKLKGKNLWDIDLNKGMSWSWKHLLNLRDKIKEFVNVKLGNGKTCSLWFDKWHPGGPLSKLIDHMMIYMAGLDINAKVIDLIDNNSWCWPIDWVGEYDSVLNVPVPKLVNDLEDKPVWCNKKSLNSESHSHLCFSCNYSKRLWERLKPMGLLDDIGNDWAMERNIKRMEHRDRSVDGLFKVVFENVRLKLMGLKLKWTSDVIKAFKIWNLPMKRDKDVLENIKNIRLCLFLRTKVSMSWVLYDHSNCISQFRLRYGAGILSRVIGFKVIYVGIAAAYNVSGLACFGTVMVYVAYQLVYGDGSGDSDWPWDSLMIQRNNAVPLRSDTIWLVQNGCSFHGLHSEDPNQHVKDFLKLMDSLDLNGENRERTHLCFFQFSLRNQASNWLECLPAGSITIISIRSMDSFQGLTPKSPSSWHRPLAPKDLTLYDNECWNNPRDFAKPVKAITLPQNVPSTSDRRLVEVQRLMEAHLALIQPTQLNKITTSCEIYSSPHDTQYCMENPEQAFTDYASLRANEMGGKRVTPNYGPRNFIECAEPWKRKPHFTIWANIPKPSLTRKANRSPSTPLDDMIEKVNLLWNTIFEKLNDTSSPKNAGNSMAPKSTAAISYAEKEELRKKGFKSPSKLLSLKYLSPASIKELNKNPSSPKRVHFVNSIVILSTNIDMEEEDISSTNACNLDLDGMVKGKEGVKEQGKEEK
ncbi:RNA-directed DNA polymerase, eukaryota, reverse transcriptase zinc-binding domain protein [Tanacetum coccineum]